MSRRPSWLDLDAATFDRDTAGQLALEIPDAELSAAMGTDDALDLEWG